MLKIGDIEANPLAKHKALKTTKKIQIPFSENEVNEVLDNLALEAYILYYNRYMLVNSYRIIHAIQYIIS